MSNFSPPARHQAHDDDDDEEPDDDELENAPYMFDFFIAYFGTMSGLTEDITGANAFDFGGICKLDLTGGPNPVSHSGHLGGALPDTIAERAVYRCLPALTPESSTAP